MTVPSMGWIGRYRTALANGLLVHKLLQLLKTAGVVIEPYLLYQEGIDPAAPGPADGGPPGFEFSEAGIADSEAIAAIGMAPDQLEQIREDFRLGRRCFAFRRGDEIVAASWCDTKEIHFPPCRRALARNEAYLYHAEVSRRYRGHDLAGHLRAKSYAALRSSGCDLLYSYSDYFNRPAKRFKEKIGARVLVVGLHLGCFGLWEKNWVRRVNDPVLPASPSSGAVSPR